ncbi:ankyrin repeat domain-containing protein [Tritonibacter aquimaris]|nr:ankyrin repeat domain-containing protein [Tritonibacter aquimaris]
MRIETEIIKTLLRFSDLNGQSSALQQQLTQLLRRYSDGMSRDQYQRYSHLAGLYVELHHTRCQLAVTSDIDDPNQRNALLSKIAQLQKQLDEAIEFRNTCLAAQELCQANSFEDFCRLLPQVRLDRLQGRAPGKHSCFPLIWAISAREKPLERVQMMVAAGARLDLTDRLGATVLHEMAAMKRKAAVRLPILRFLRLQGADLEARDLKGRTPLHIALDRGSIEDVSFFLDAGARVHEGDLNTAVREPAKLQLLLRHIDHDDAMVSTAHGLTGWLEGELYEARQ